MPYNSLRGNELSDLLFGIVKVLVPVLEFGTQFVRFAFNFARPPTANVVDRIEDFFGRFFDRKCCGEILPLHCSLLVIVLGPGYPVCCGAVPAPPRVLSREAIDAARTFRIRSPTRARAEWLRRLSGRTCGGLHNAS